MKKLLGAFGTITMTGSGMTGIIGNAPVTPKNEINYSQIQDENLPILKRIKRQNSQEINILEKIKVVIRTEGIVYSSGAVFNNKLYFGSSERDHNVYEYDPVTGRQKIVIRTNGQIFSSGTTLNNKLYIGSNDHNVYEYDPVTEQKKIIIRTEGKVYSSGVVFNNKVYFGSFDNNVYEYDPVTEQQKIVIITNGDVWSAGIVLNNKLYFGSWDHNVYEYDPATQQQKIVIKTGGEVFSSGLTLNNKVYFSSWDHNVYEYDPVTEQQKIVIKSKWRLVSSGVVLNNKLYFGSWDHNVYEYDPSTKQQKIVIITMSNVNSSGVAFNNKVYFGSNDNNVYEYDPATGKQKIVIITKGSVQSSGIVLNNKVYFGSIDNNVYEYSNYYDLGQINNNSDTAILSELNYLNPDLDISQLEIINKTNNSAIIKEKNNLNNNINVQYSIINGQNKIIDFHKLIEKSLFFKYNNKNADLKYKEIKNIDINNLNFSNVKVTRDSKLLHSADFQNPCFEKKTYNNKSSLSKIIVIPPCEYNSKSKLVFQITTGLTKTKQENKLNGWNINPDDEMKLSDFINLNNKQSEIINELSSEFDLSNTNKQEQEMILHSFDKKTEFEAKINPQEQAKVKYSVREIHLETTLNLKQKITGIISIRKKSDTIDFNDLANFYEGEIFTLSIKELMQILQKNGLLPNEITINEDESTTFNGKAKIILTEEAEPKLIINTSIV